MKINLKKTSQAATLFASIVFGAQAQVHPEEAVAVTPFQIQKLDVSSLYPSNPKMLGSARINWF